MVPPDDGVPAAMRRALALAAQGLGTTSPNPAVGCVVLDASGRPVGEGFHARAGGPHAEVVALAAAGERARGGTAVVTLEPCAHTGRTGPCAQELLRAGIRRVVYAVPDPVAGGGAARLRAAGVTVEEGLLSAEASRVNEAWLHAVRTGRPHVTWKYAASLDGRVAAADGSSRWVTGPEARTDAHRLRAASDAVVVGSGTVVADDPHLAARGVEAPRQPLRVVVDTEARTPPGARVLNRAAPTLLAVADDAGLGPLADLPAHVEVLRLPRSRAGLDLGALLAALYARDVRAVMVEGGPTLAGSLVRAGLVDRVVGYLAPVLLGGDALPALAGPVVPTLAEAPRLRIDEVVTVGHDVRITARPRPEET